MSSPSTRVVRIDAHQHFWQPARGDYGWLDPGVPGLARLCRDFLPEDLLPLLRRHDVRRTVLVQAAGSEAETDFMLELAAEFEFVGGVVGWVDLSRPAAVATLERWAREPKFKGVRPMLQDLPQADWIATAPHRDVVQALRRLGLRFDALVKPRHLAALLRFVDAWPDLPVVIDHAAKPLLADGWTAEWAQPWRRGIAELAERPQVACKFSGLLTEMSAYSRDDPSSAIDTIRPAWDHLLRCFGPGRLMWGSDWPVLTLAGDYGTWVSMSDALVDELPHAERELIRCRSAQAFYGLRSAEAG
jgi:L-fuconolactonase